LIREEDLGVQKNQTSEERVIILWKLFARRQRLFGEFGYHLGQFLIVIFTIEINKNIFKVLCETCQNF